MGDQTNAEPTRGYESVLPSVPSKQTERDQSSQNLAMENGQNALEATVERSPEEIFDAIGSPHGIEFLAEVARGGMGAVHRARDTELNREIAVKVLLETHRERPLTVRRFIEEAQIGGQLQHPGIVPVYGIGRLHDHSPYFTMKLVKGRTLSALLKQRNDISEDRTRFLKIFEQVAQAVGYAHSKNVIHRDLKPSNIMVGNFGEVQVMDWGLAKILGAEKAEGEAPKSASSTTPSVVSIIRTNRPGSWGTLDLDRSDTESGSVMGTPAYMAPEQAMGEVEVLDARADVFGLGAILCEILTGKPPYVGPDPASILRSAMRAELEPAFLRLAQCGCDDELVDLAKRCLAAEPAHRPENGGALADDLTAYLESVEARLRLEQLARVEAQAKAIEERKRRKTQLVLAAVTSLALFAGIVGTGWGLKREQRARQAAEVAESNERDQRQLAERRRAEAESAQTRAVAAEADTKAFSDFLVNQVLAAARPQDVAGGVDFDITVVQALEKAEARIDELFAQRPVAEATTRQALGITWRDLGRIDDALVNLRRAADLRTQHLGPENELTLESLNSLGIALMEAGKNREAIVLLEKVRAERSKILSPDDPATLQTANNIALITKRMGKHSEAIAIFRDVAERQTENPKLGPKHPDTLTTLHNLAEAYRSAHQLPEAAELFNRVRSQMATQLAADHPQLLKATNGLGATCLDMGKTAEAIELFEQVCDGRIRKLGPDHPQTLTAMHNLATGYERAGRSDDALELFAKVCSGREKRLGPDAPLTIRTMLELGKSYFATKRYDDAIVMLKKVRERLVGKRGPASPDLADASCVLADAYLAAKKPSDAAVVCAELVASDRRRNPINAIQLSDHLSLLGKTHLQAHQDLLAEKAFREAMALDDQKRPNDWRSFEVRSQCGESLLSQKRLIEAEALLLAGYEGLKRNADKIPASTRHTCLAAAIDRLIRLSTAAAKPDDVARWQKEKSLLGPPVQ